MHRLIRFPSPGRIRMETLVLRAESLAVESFQPDAAGPAGPADLPGGCICDVAPCICTRADDCAAA